MLSNKSDVLYQVTDWDYYHEDLGDGSSTQYTIRIYGTTLDDKKIFVKVKNFKPYFYVQIPKQWQQHRIAQYVAAIKDLVDKEYIEGLDIWNVVDKHIFWEFTNYELYNFICFEFNNMDSFWKFARAIPKVKVPKSWNIGNFKFKLYETNMDPLLRCMHKRNVKSVGWIKIGGGKYNHLTGYNKPSNNEICIETDWQNLDPVEDTNIAKIIVASFDIECESEDGSFPQAERDNDRIIQIGTTFSKFGESECFYQHIVTLKSCDPIEGADVESYDTEREVLLAWTRMIQRTNPDVLTGYNIFGFDFRYMKDRAAKLGCHSSFCKLGRVPTEESKFILKDLSSSALGENKLYYYEILGRVNIDVMKIVQRDHKLGSYKLDNVAAEFIKEKITNIEITDEGNSIIHCKTTYGLEIGRYIKIYFNDGLSDNAYKNDYKFHVIGISPKYIIVKGILEGEAVELDKYTIYWCQAKDDVSPADIFRLQKGNSADRAIVAKYCLQDCRLINKLINKLQILTNNISMANVCYVPLKYIILRGQGIKIFSLVGKKCQEKNHVIPVIKKPYVPKEGEIKPWMKKFIEENKVEEENEGYEGATVFEPTVAVHQEPIVVFDYNSLYPSSMIYRNISHECIVKNNKYRNLPDYYYDTVSYADKEGKLTECVYARCKNGNRGILPEILSELLTARAVTRGLAGKAEEEGDEFKAKILDCLQLAFKMTANSLYGQTGASTSPIYMKDIAGSTCATGREMLNAARIYTEMMFPTIVDAAFKSYDDFVEKMETLFSKNRIDELITKENLRKLKTKNNNEPVERYFYLRIFKENRDNIDDKKFINGKLKHTCKDDFLKWVYESLLTLLKDYTINPDVIYGDTDSIFIKYNLADRKTGKNDTSHECLKTSIKLGIVCSGILHKILPSPQNMAYEKTLHPLALLSKKRYVGNKYEFSPDEYTQMCMGIVLKRRDNAPIVKIVIGGIVRSILNDRSIEKAIEFTKQILNDLLSGKYPLDKFIISKSIKGGGLTKEERIVESIKPKDKRSYADRTRIVHAVLADRMADRDPGNKPQSNDRIPYAYVLVDDEVELQGDRVEHPDYIVEHNLSLDYLFYLTNQIMKPALQFLVLLTNNPNEIFNNCIIKETNRRAGKRPLNYYFTTPENNSDKKSMFDEKKPINNNKCQVDKKPKVIAKKKVVVKPKPNSFKLDL